MAKKHKPQTNSLIFATSGQLSSFMRVPAQSETLTLVAYKLRLRLNRTLWDAAVLGSVENEDPSTWCHSSNDIGVLWLVSSFVDFSGVVDLLLDVHLYRSLVAI